MTLYLIEQFDDRWGQYTKLDLGYVNSKQEAEQIIKLLDQRQKRKINDLKSTTQLLRIINPNISCTTNEYLDYRYEYSSVEKFDRSKYGLS